MAPISSSSLVPNCRPCRLNKAVSRDHVRGTEQRAFEIGGEDSRTHDCHKDEEFMVLISHCLLCLLVCFVDWTSSVYTTSTFGVSQQYSQDNGMLAGVPKGGRNHGIQGSLPLLQPRQQCSCLYSAKGFTPDTSLCKQSCKRYCLSPINSSTNGEE